MKTKHPHGKPMPPLDIDHNSTNHNAKVNNKGNNQQINHKPGTNSKGAQ